MERRNRPVMFYIEPYLYDILKEIAKGFDMSASAYIRSMILKDLMRKDRLPPALKDGLLVGMQSLLDEAEVA